MPRIRPRRGAALLRFLPVRAMTLFVRLLLVVPVMVSAMRRERQPLARGAAINSALPDI